MARKSWDNELLSTAGPPRSRSVFTPTRIARLFHDEELAMDLLRSVSLWQRSPTSLRRVCRDLSRLIAEALEAVGNDLARHPHRATLEQFIRDERELADEETGRVLELIYSHMVNRFKGDIAEILAIGPSSEYIRGAIASGRIPRCARLVLGGDCRQQTGTAWAKGPDALIVASGSDHVNCDPASADVMGASVNDSLVIYGIIEVKSYSLTASAARDQLRSHRIRLRRGLQLDHREWSPNDLWFCGVHQGRIDTVNGRCAQNIGLVNILLVPGKRPSPTSPGAPSAVARLHLPVTRERLMAAAYCMTEWFTGLLGQAVFERNGSPWPEMTAHEAGFNRMKEALYHIGLRDLKGLKEHNADRVRWARRAARLEAIAARLYNAYGWGLDEALKYRGMMWVVRDPVSSERRISTTPTRPPSGLRKLDDPD